MTAPALTLRSADTPELLAETAEMAKTIWHEYFPFLLSSEQIDYMVEKFQSLPAMEEQVKEHGYEYYRLLLGKIVVGYTGVCPEGEGMFLSKLYLKKEYRGQGLASQAFEALKTLCRQRGWKTIRLTCNKQNAHSLDVYHHWGFACIRKEVTPIGGGFVMDDDVLLYTL